MNDVVEALQPVVEVLDELTVRYRVGGSVASSAFGVPRSTLDVDIACELGLAHVARFVDRLWERYYVDADMISEAIRRRATFNLVHLATMLKVDVFIRKGRAFDASSFERVTRKALDVALRPEGNTHAVGPWLAAPVFTTLCSPVFSMSALVTFTKTFESA